MFLPSEDRKLFFKNWLGLLSFVNKEYGVVKDFGCPKSQVGLDIKTVAKIKDVLWENSAIIETYLQQTALNEEDTNIVRSWHEKHIKEKFLIIKDLKHYTVFFDSKTDTLYGVSGITNSIGEMVPFFPVIAETVLLPFKGNIIYDSLLVFSRTIFGKNIRESINEKYKEIKSGYGIITDLQNTDF